MTKIRGLLVRAVVISAFALSAGPISAQNVMSLRIDTVTANPGATVDVRVMYTFTSTHSHNIHDYNARFLFDTLKSHLNAYILTGSASAALSFPNDTIGSHTGLLMVGNGQEIDLTDSILFTIRMTIDSNADTALVRWDTNWVVFGAGNEGVDTVHQKDGWIRTLRPLSVRDVAVDHGSLQIYPNPAREEVTINGTGFGGERELTVYDAMGRAVFDGPLRSEPWHIPSEFGAGAYEIVLHGMSALAKAGDRFMGTLIVAPR